MIIKQFLENSKKKKKKSSKSKIDQIPKIPRYQIPKIPRYSVYYILENKLTPDWSFTAFDVSLVLSSVELSVTLSE